MTLRDVRAQEEFEDSQIAVTWGGLKEQFDINIFGWNLRPGLPRVPVGPLASIPEILGAPNIPRAWVPPVVIGERPQGVLSPQTAGRGTIPEKIDVPEGWEEYEDANPWSVEPILETRPGRTPDPFPFPTDQLPPSDARPGEIGIHLPVDDSEFEDNEMAHTWFHSATELALGIWGPQPAGGTVAGPSSGAMTPAQTDAWLSGATYGTDNGRPGCKRRRRQRNILTQSNLNMLFQIATLPNNANVRVALSRAIK